LSVVYHPDWDLSEKGKKDVERHHKKIDDVLRKNVKDVIAEESIITKRKGKTIKVPIRGLKDYKFVHDTKKQKKQGVGQGKGKPGDVIVRQPKKQGEPGKPGDKPGEDYIEAEVDIDYFIKIMFEDLGLPWIEEKDKAYQLIPSGWKFDRVSKTGIMPRLHRKRSLLEALKRVESYIKEIMDVTGCSYEDASRALSQTNGDLEEATELVLQGKVDQSVSLYTVDFEDDDLRFKTLEQDYRLHSNAVVLAMMDTSGSMTIDKKYLCRSLLFWIVEFLKRVYDFVDIRFIVHTTEAKIVDEDTFFRKGESGGTYCWTALDKALYLIETEYPINEWNVYVIYVSDGEDFDSNKTCQYIKKLLDKKVNMFSYVEVKPLEAYGLLNLYHNGSTLMQKIKERWKPKCTSELGAEFCRRDDIRLITAVIKGKNHVYPALKHILFDKGGRYGRTRS